MDTLNIAVEPLRAFLVQIGAYLPRLGIALAIALAGWLLAKALRFGTVKALRALNFHVLTERAGLDAFLQQGGTRKDTADLFGLIVFWLVVLGALIVAFNGLGLSQVTEVLSKVLLFLPKLLIGLLVVVFGLYFARFVGQSVQAWCRGADIGDAELLGRIVQYAIVTFVAADRHRPRRHRQRPGAADLPDPAGRHRAGAGAGLRHRRQGPRGRAAGALVPAGAAAGRPLTPIRVQRLRKSRERPPVRGPMRSSLVCSARDGHGRRSTVVPAFSGPRSRAATEARGPAPHQHRPCHALGRATANGACARRHHRRPAGTAGGLPSRSPRCCWGRRFGCAGAGSIRGRPGGGRPDPVLTR